MVQGQRCHKGHPPLKCDFITFERQYSLIQSRFPWRNWNALRVFDKIEEIFKGNSISKKCQGDIKRKSTCCICSLISGPEMNLSTTHPLLFCWAGESFFKAILLTAKYPDSLYAADIRTVTCFPSNYAYAHALKRRSANFISAAQLI